MVVIMKERATEAQVQAVIAQLVEMGYDVHRSTGANQAVLGAVGDGRGDSSLIEVQEGVDRVHRISVPYKLASRTFKPENTVITIDDVRIGARVRVEIRQADATMKLPFAIVTGGAATGGAA